MVSRSRATAPRELTRPGNHLSYISPSSRAIVLGSLALLLVSQILTACEGVGHHQPAEYEETAHFPHDPTAFTEGLVALDTVLFESTGQYGHSELRRVDLRSGRVLASRALPADRFGEGLALLNDRLYQLTWKAGVAYTYDAATLTPGDSFHYTGEGWGLATDGRNLIMSDGSDSLRVLSPATFQVQRVVHVSYQDAPIYQLNELEYVDGELLANVYQTNWVVRIDPATGVVREALDFADLYQNRSALADVMNGIALAPDGRQLLLTGKRWPVVFQVQLRSLHAER
jgi:glutamine cyclotransferase